MIDIYTDWGKPDACIEIYDILLSTCKEGSEKYRYYQQQKADYIENKSSKLKASVFADSQYGFR